MNYLRSIFWVAVGLLLAISVTGTQAQGSTTVTIALPEYLRNTLPSDAFAAFESEHPGVSVQPVFIGPDKLFISSPANGVNDYLDAVQKLVSAADVTFVTNSAVTPAAIRAGYYLDLSSVASADPSLSPSDYVNGAWQSYQWDNGFWALPATVDTVGLVYNQDAFDAAGLAYPNADWTIDDLANAADKLTQRDSSGNVTLPGLVTVGNGNILLRSLSGQSLVDTVSVPNVPQLVQPALETQLTKWLQLYSNGVFATQLSNPEDASRVPMQIGGSSAFFRPKFSPNATLTNQPRLAVAPLPGGLVGLTLQGFAVSAATTQPDLAYQLAKYVTETPSILSILGGGRPARQNLTDLQPTLAPSGSSGGGIFVNGGGLPISPEAQAMIDNLLQYALPASELNFSDYLSVALQNPTPNMDVHAALQSAEAQAISDLKTAADRKGNTTFAVATPIPPVAMQPGQISLRFSAGFLLDTNQWDALLRQFAASDAQVGQVVLSTTNQPNAVPTDVDCFYSASNLVPSLDLTTVLNLDPYFSADASFNPDDLVTGALTQLQRGGRTWGYPLVLEPLVIHYYADILTRAGVTLPTNGVWTADQFANALTTLQATLPADQKAFANRTPGDTALLALIAAFGGLPLDFRTNPPTINFTDPATVSAIQRALDLAKNGDMDYQALASNTFRVSVRAGDNPDPMYTDSLGGGFAMLKSGGAAQANPYQITGYPSGMYTAVSYDIGAGYIRADGQNADACYRLFGFLAQHPELFQGMPASRSQFDNPALTAAIGPNAADFSHQMDTTLQSQNTIVIPGSFGPRTGNSADRVVRFILDQAFDNYVLNDANLTTELQTAQSDAQDFETCMTSAPPYDPTDTSAYDKAVKSCATSVDPNLAAMFPPTGG